MANTIITEVHSIVQVKNGKFEVIGRYSSTDVQ